MFNYGDIMTKLYIAILDEALKEDAGHVYLSIAHVVLMAHKKFAGLAAYDYWLENNFRKCLVLVNRKEFDKIKQLDNVVVATESAMPGWELTAAVCPRPEWPNVIKFAKLFKPS